MNISCWDVHNHILPGLDDGSSDEEESFLLLNSEYEQGVRHIIFTPHYRAGMFTVPADVREQTYLEFAEKAGKRFPDMEFFLGCELHTRRDMTEVLSDKRCRMAGGRYVLIEFSGNTPVMTISHTLHDVMQQGYTPIIAHAERCVELHSRTDELLQLWEDGAMIQINADTILEGMFSARRKFAKRLLEEDAVDFIASDAHDMQYRPPKIEAAMQVIQKRYGEEQTRRIFSENPETITKG